MCGIAGILRFDDQPIERSRLEAMLAAIRHRGPDGEGIAELGRCGLVHSRLAIVDLPGGAQPMSASACEHCRGLTVVFNGEIYNHRELRRQLEARGHRFQTDHCDTEVLLHGYREWDVELLRDLDGMFAFALWDSIKERLLLARDRVGKKPLYRRLNGREMLFASLIPAIVRAAPPEQAPRINRDALLHYLRLGYTDGHSLLAGVEEIPPGHYELIDPRGRSEIHTYSRPLETYAAIQAPWPRERHPLEAICDALKQAVWNRLEADVPIGCFLSGGVDSSLVAALAQRQLLRSRQGPLHTFNVAMPDADYDESPRAQVVAQHLGTRHTELRAEPNRDVFEDVKRLIALSGEPTADSSILPTFWLSQAVRQHVPVALSGDGGDELFGGYDRYRALRLIQRHGAWLRRIPQGLLARGEDRSWSGKLRRLTRASHACDPVGWYRDVISIFDDARISRLLGEQSTALDAFADQGLPDWPEHDAAWRSAMSWDFAHYLPFDLLRKVDRASMAVALEVRCPLLDADVCFAAAQAPTDMHLPRGRPKGILRQIARRLGLPRSITNARKRGFAIPIGRWFKGPLRQPLAERLLEGRLETLGLRRPAIQRLYDEHTTGQVDHTHRLFALLSLAIWLDWLHDSTSKRNAS